MPVTLVQFSLSWVWTLRITVWTEFSFVLAPDERRAVHSPLSLGAVAWGLQLCSLDKDIRQHGGHF